MSKKKDWKLHKIHCTPTDSKHLKSAEIRNNCLIAFTQDNYAEILEKLVDVIDETGLSKAELVVAMDFVADESGRVPSLSDPPEFEIRSVSEYIDVSRLNRPEWLSEEYMGAQELNNILAALIDTAERMTKDHLLCIFRGPGGISVNRVSFHIKSTNGQLYSDSTVKAARKALEYDDYGPLSNILDTHQVDFLKRKWSAGVGFDESQLDRVRMLLNRNFGANFDLRGSDRCT
jgi:hypothetical protein